VRQPTLTLAGACPLLVSSSTATAERLAERFFASNQVQKENIQLLQSGEGLIVTKTGAIFSS